MDHNWNNETENLLQKWAYTAKRNEGMYSQKEMNIYEHISLIAAAINAGINFTITLLPEKEQKYSLFITGILNIIALLLTAIYKIYTTPEIPEENRWSAIAWGKLNHDIANELMRPPEQRENVDVFIMTIRNEFQKLRESSPTLSDEVKKKYAITIEAYKIDAENR